MSVVIRTGLRPGDLGYITYLHGKIYGEEYEFDNSFEAYVARPMCDFTLSDNPRQRIWLVETDDGVVGCIAIVDSGDNLAQLRWFLLTKEMRGKGIGKELMRRALDFCRGNGFDGVFLWTVDILEAAAGLYRSFGFSVTEEKEHVIWGRLLNEQRYDLRLGI